MTARTYWFRVDTLQSWVPEAWGYELGEEDFQRFEAQVARHVGSDVEVHVVADEEMRLITDAHSAEEEEEEFERDREAMMDGAGEWLDDIRRGLLN